MNLTATRARKGAAITLGAVAASAALVLSGMTSASAANVQLGPDDIIGFENGAEGTDGYNYDQWHIGSATDPDTAVDESLTFNECSVTFLAPPAGAVASVTQVLKGFPIDGRPDTVEEIRAVFESLAVTMESGSVTLQVPFFLYEDDQDETPEFTTVRNETAFTGAGTFTLDGQALTDSGGVGDTADYEELLAQIEAGFDQGLRYEVLGFGITGAEDSVVNSLSALGDTFFFGTGDCLPATPPPAPGTGGPVVQQPTVPVAVDTGH